MVGAGGCGLVFKSHPYQKAAPTPTAPLAPDQGARLPTGRTAPSTTTTVTEAPTDPIDPGSPLWDIREVLTLAGNRSTPLCAAFDDTLRAGLKVANFGSTSGSRAQALTATQRTALRQLVGEYATAVGALDQQARNVPGTAFDPSVGRMAAGLRDLASAPDSKDLRQSVDAYLAQNQRTVGAVFGTLGSRCPSPLLSSIIRLQTG
jgi:hypothetical protein